MTRCNIHDCTEPRCPESDFWCKKHYVQFRAAGMGGSTTALPASEARGERPPATPPVLTGIRGKIRPFGGK